jgi:hypothetical protein
MAKRPHPPAAPAPRIKPSLGKRFDKVAAQHQAGNPAPVKR